MPKFPTNICPLFFRDSPLKGFTIANMIDTFFKQNLLKFLPSRDHTSLNVSFEKIDFKQLEHVTVDSSLLYPLLFANISVLGLYGDVIRIQSGLFKSLTRLRQIRLGDSNPRKLFHRGIDWILDLNINVHVDLKNDSQMTTNMARHRFDIYIEQMYERVKNGMVLEREHFFSDSIFPDEDFCIYVRFPFERLVIISLNTYTSKLTCTFSWLSRYYKRYLQFLDRSNYSDLIISLDWPIKISTCDFEKL